MATLTRGQTFGATETITNTKLHNLVDLGGISAIVNADIDASAQISDTKLDTISTGNKVSGTSFLSLASVPSAAGRLPEDNLPTTFSATLLQALYPVGSVYINATDSTNPNTLFGFGTWVAFGAGRVPVGYDSGDTDFDAAEETGGSKTHTLTTDEIPSHSHTQKVNGLHATGYGNNVEGSDNNTSAQNSTTSTDTTGGGSAHNNLQPYITVYMWKRTA